MDNDFGVQTRLTYKQIKKNLIIVSVLVFIAISCLIYGLINKPKNKMEIEDYPIRIKLAGVVVQVKEHRKYITVEIEDHRFDESINVLVYSPQREKLKGISEGDFMKATGFKVSRPNKRSYEAKKVKFIKRKPTIFDDDL